MKFCCCCWYRSSNDVGEFGPYSVRQNPAQVWKPHEQVAEGENKVETDFLLWTQMTFVRLTSCIGRNGWRRRCCCFVGNTEFAVLSFVNEDGVDCGPAEKYRACREYIEAREPRYDVLLYVIRKDHGWMCVFNNN